MFFLVWSLYMSGTTKSQLSVLLYLMNLNVHGHNRKYHPLWLAKKASGNSHGASLSS